MMGRPAQSGERIRGDWFKTILLEAGIVAVLGVALSLLANQISPRGLNLAHNYFPGGVAPLPVAPKAVSGATNTQAPAPASSLAARLAKNGLHLIERAKVEELFHDPPRQQNLILFVDARDTTPYGEGHIPGAYEFDPYYWDKYVADVLPLCQIADQIIVYCTGGEECVDSESAALKLRELGIPSEKLFVYGGGITEWTAAKLPVERGARDSGDILNAAP